MGSRSVTRTKISKHEFRTRWGGYRLASVRSSRGTTAMSSRCARRGRRWASAKPVRASYMAARSRIFSASSQCALPRHRRESSTKSPPDSPFLPGWARFESTCDERGRTLPWKEHFRPETQATDVRHPNRESEWREQFANAFAVGPGEQWRQIIEQGMRDRVELERVATQYRSVGGEDAEALVLPPDVLGTAVVMRDTESPIAVAAFETAV